MSNTWQKTRRWMGIVLIVAALALLAGLGANRLAERRTQQESIRETPATPKSPSEPATLGEALTMAREALDWIERNVRDYSAIIIKRERSGHSFSETAMFAKIREKPFSVYLHFLGQGNDTSVKGREVIYVQGRNDNKLIVHTPGFIGSALGTRYLDPNGFIAMLGQRHPITDIGLANLCRQLIERGEAISDPSQARVRRYLHARINTRACTLLEITYPVHEPDKWGYLVRVFVDNQWRLPIRVEVYDLPLDRSKGPQLAEEYTYLELKINNGYTDADFDPKDPQYRFR
jgi:hypothetical protein